MQQFPLGLDLVVGVGHIDIEKHVARFEADAFEGPSQVGRVTAATVGWIEPDMLKT